MKKLLSLIPLILITITVCAQRPDRSVPPALGKAKNLQLPPIQRFTLSNGIQVLLMEKHSVPMIQINTLLQTGAFDDPVGKEGLSNFVMDLVDEGAGSLDALQLADEIEFLGASITSYSGNFSSGINCTVPVSKLDPALKIMGELMLHPTFAEGEIDRVRKLKLTGLLQNYDEPTVIATRAFNKFLYDAGTPYGRFANEQSIKSFTKEDVVKYHQANFVVGNTTLLVVGDITREKMIPVLEKYLASCKTGNITKASKPVPSQIKGRPMYIIDKPGAAQSVIRIGRIGVPRSAPDHDAMVVMNTILGGSFASRLNTNLREVHGYSYGASSGFTFWNVPGPFVASSSVQTDVTGLALGEFFTEFKNMIAPLPDADLTRGKNYEALGYAGNFESNNGIAAALAELVLYQLPDSYFNTYVEKILTVDKKSVEAASKKYIVPDNMLVVVVGDRAKIEEGVKKLNLGKIQNLTIEDILGKKPEFK